jgi:hypothetical protein
MSTELVKLAAYACLNADMREYIQDFWQSGMKSKLLPTDKPPWSEFAPIRLIWCWWT